MSVFSSTYRPLLSLALPLIFIQICQASLGLVDTMVAGQYHYHDLAGVGLGSAMWTPVFILLTGIMFVLVPKVSGLLAVGQHDEVKRVYLRGKKVAFVLSILGFLLVHVLAFASGWLVSDSKVAAITQAYLHFVAFAMPGFVYILLYRFMSEGSSKLMPIIKVFIALLIVNSLLNILFVFGAIGIEGLGGVGCGLATAVSAYFALFMMKRLVQREVPEAISHSAINIDMNEATEQLKEGLPIGVAFVLEVLALTTLAFFAASLGVKQVAAHQIAINLAMIVFMIPVALSSATTIRIASITRADGFSSRRHVANAALIMTCAYGLIIAVLLVGLGEYLLTLFSQDEGILGITAGLLVYIALFQFFDAIQIVAAGILRGLQEFVSPLLVIFIVYWFAVVPVSYLAAEKGWWFFSGGIDGIWILLASGIGFAALILCVLSFKQVYKPDNLVPATP
ncbi:MATE family efflux transporter [Marinomonas sp. PE14-40]|uniref:MATE family efflux transporter n=1 Tax=Marinomonas sp. PE14-40 TaxID=3060621 RepID=UPI00308AF90E|nr:FbsQ [Marinomonas sp.]